MRFHVSGLAVRPNPDAQSSNNPDAIFQLAENASSSDEQSQIRRTITMVNMAYPERI
jgi:hypothetical protein